MADFSCKECKKFMDTQKSFDQHIAGKKHKEKMRVIKLKLKKKALEAIAEKAFEDLQLMNRWLVKFGKPAAASKTAARKVLALLHVNIYDLLDLEDDATPEEAEEILHESVAALARYSKRNKLIFPLKKAKAGGGLAEFLRELRRFW